MRLLDRDCVSQIPTLALGLLLTGVGVSLLYPQSAATTAAQEADPDPMALRETVDCHGNPVGEAAPPAGSSGVSLGTNTRAPAVPSTPPPAGQTQPE
jgi:hypothetical protein